MNKELARYYMDLCVVWAERVDETLWKVYGPWHEPFIVDNDNFQKYFTEI